MQHQLSDENALLETLEAGHGDETLFHPLTKRPSWHSIDLGWSEKAPR